MEKRYKNIFWGYIILLINILPEFIGFLLISTAVEEIIREFDNEAFKKSLRLGYFMTLCTLIIFIAAITGVDYLLIKDNFAYEFILRRAFEFLLYIVSLVMSYNILSGTIDLYLSKDRVYYAGIIEGSQKLFIILSIVGLIIEVVSINIVNDFYLGFAGIYNVIIMIYYVRIINKIKNSFNEDLIVI